MKGKTYACAAAAVELVDVPSEIRLLPMGKVVSRKGEFVVDEESIRTMQRVFKARGIDIVVDYEHQTLEDVQAPAGGWITDIYPGDGCLMGRVEWTPKGAEYVKNKEYRYLSPVVLVRENDKKALCISSVALTNVPAIDGMYPIVNAAQIDDTLTILEDEGGSIMDLKKIAQLLGLSEAATEEEVEEALKAVIEKAASEAAEGTEVVANKVILTQLGLKEGAKTEEVTAKILSLQMDGSEDLKAEVKALKERIAQKDADEKVEIALKAGKIMAAQKDWARSYALKDPDGFDKFLELASATVPMGKLDAVNAPQKEPTVEEKVLKGLAVTAEDIEKFGK